MKKMTIKTILTLTALALLLTFTVSGTLAYISTKTNEVENVFTPVHVTVDVTDKVDTTTGVKSDVVITNTSNIQAYIRAAIVGYWCDAKGNIVAPWDPTDENQGTFVGLTGSNWVKSGDYYYYTEKVDAGMPTPNALFTSYTEGTAPVEGAHLVIDILAQAIQAEPASAVQEAWGFVPGSN